MGVLDTNDAEIITEAPVPFINFGGSYDPASPTPAPPGLPLGLYTSHWHRTINTKGCASDNMAFSIAQRDCQASYAPDLDYDIHGLFSIDD